MQPATQAPDNPDYLAVQGQLRAARRALRVAARRMKRASAGDIATLRVGAVHGAECRARVHTAAARLRQCARAVTRICRRR